MVVREISIGNWNKLITLCNSCAVYTEHFQNKQLGIITYLNPKCA